MTLRGVQPLDNEEWEQLITLLEKNPTDDQVSYIQNAVSSGRNLKVHR